MWQKKSVQEAYAEGELDKPSLPRESPYYFVRQRSRGVTDMYRVDRIEPLLSGEYRLTAGADHQQFTVQSDEMLTYSV
jgi:hypothetical protein